MTTHLSVLTTVLYLGFSFSSSLSWYAGCVFILACVLSMIGRRNAGKLCPGEQSPRDTFHSSPDWGLICGFSLYLDWGLTYINWCYEVLELCGAHAFIKFKKYVFTTLQNCKVYLRHYWSNLNTVFHKYYAHKDILVIDFTLFQLSTVGAGGAWKQCANKSRRKLEAVKQSRI